MFSSKCVTVIAGGNSSERDVSLVSGQCVYKALVELDIQTRLLRISDVTDLVSKLDEIDVAFICLHGGDGENGTVQRVLEEHGIPYTGSGPNASALGMDKLACKRVLRSVGVPVPRALPYQDEDLGSFADTVLMQFSLPVVIKSSSQGASIWVKRVDTAEALIPTCEAIREKLGPFFAEEFISGRELTVPVLRIDEKDEALPIIEVHIKTDFFSYEAKYTEGLNKMVVPAPLGDRLTKVIQDVSVKTHQILGCWGFSRVDILLTEEGTPYVLETNTLPGMTPHSAMYKSAAVIGLDFPHLASRRCSSQHSTGQWQIPDHLFPMSLWETG